MRPSRVLVWVCAAIVAGGFGTAAVGQTPTHGADSRDLSELTSEIRLLRQAVEGAARTQGETQAIGVYLSAQQARIVQVTARLDTAAKDLETAVLRSQQLAQTLTFAEEALARAETPERRAQLELESRALRLAQQQATLEEQRARLRESELSHSLDAESARWMEFIARLEQILRR